MSAPNTALADKHLDIANCPIFVFINSGSGADVKDINSRIMEIFEAKTRFATLHEIPRGASANDSCHTTVQKAAREGGIVVAAGGDGTVNLVASLCYKHNVPFGIIPLGTFNYVARALDIPLELEAAVEAIITGKLRIISAGFIQEHLFLNNASFGLYPTLIRKREEASKRYGRKRIVAAVSALQSLFSKQKHYTIKFNTDERSGSHRTSMVFVGNNTLQLSNFGLEASECTAKNQLAVVILRRVNHWQLCRLMWRGIVKNLKFESKLIQFCAEMFEVETNRKIIEMVVDGEIVHCQVPLTFRVEAQALRVIVPTAKEQQA